MRHRREARVAAALLTALAVVSLPPAPARAASTDPVVVPVSFRVKNVNTSALSCEVDEADYTISGEIVGPARALKGATAPTGTLYLHEFSFGKFFWGFADVPGYDYVGALARRGHVSIVVDRLGYDDSGHPPGTQTCLGAHADIAAQIVGQLQEGAYESAGRKPLAFGRIVLAGHSVGAGAAELAAHSVDDLDVAGLMILAWADQGYSARSVQQSLAQGSDCSGDGQPAEPGGPGGYAYFGRTEQDFQQNVFADTDPAVVERVTKMRNRDPCGDNSTLAGLAAVNAAGIGDIDVPVLLLFGEGDAIFEDPAADVQARLFRSSPSVTLRRFPKAGHALTLERAAPSVQDAAADWLEEKGFVTPAPRARGRNTETRVLGRPGPTLPITGVPWHAPTGAVLLALSVALAREVGRRDQ